MSREFPDYVDPWKAADGRRTYQGTMPVRRMKRLAGLLEPGQDGAALEQLEARFKISFGRDRQGLVVIRVETQAVLPLLCQRSLEPYGEKVDRRSQLAVISHLSQAGDVPEAYDPVLVEEGRLALLDVIEDELLLAVPQVPRNPEVAAVEVSTGDAGEAVPPETERTHRPFAGLAGLMKDPERK
jgi:uncharacterized protein